MLIKYIIDEDFVNYKKTCMTIGFPYCDFKCGKELCQNSPITKIKNIEISYDNIIKRYLSNPLSEAICFQGLEPLYYPRNAYILVALFRKYTLDDIVIYTGYKKSEITKHINHFKNYKNIIIKYGRYIPNQAPHYDEVLGVNLASDNQYAERIN